MQHVCLSFAAAIPQQHSSAAAERSAEPPPLSHFHNPQGSQAYAKALAKAGILTKDEAEQIVGGLDKVRVG